MESNVQNYDFKLNLAGNLSVAFVQTPNANANYDCNYRYDSQSGQLQFKRVTSGALLYDATEYIYSSGNSRITVKMNDKDEVKKMSVERKDAELNLINKPFVALLSSLTKDEIVDIKEQSTDNYSAQLKLTSDNSALRAICNILGSVDTSISLKDATITNPVNGIGFTFTMSNGKLTAYTFTAALSVPVKGASVSLNLTYSQTANSTAIKMPSIEGLVIDGNQISAELAKINSALSAVKNDEVYSLGFTAENEMDPAWNVLGTTDTFKASLYKNPQAFNYSYYYDVHHETDGAEKYKYVIGNTTADGLTYLRNDRQDKSEESNKTAGDEFDFLTGYFALTAAQTDCLEKKVEGDTTEYTIYLKDSALLAWSGDIVDLLNTINEEGVLDVENNFDNENYTIKEAAFKVVMKGEKIDSISLDTEYKYTPTAGDYTENNVTLDSRLYLTVNKDIDKAESYEAPKNPDPNVLGMGGLDCKA